MEALLDPQLALLAAALMTPTKLLVDAIKVNLRPPSTLTPVIAFLIALLLVVLLDFQKGVFTYGTASQIIPGEVLVALTVFIGAMTMTEVHNSARGASRLRRSKESDA